MNLESLLKRKPDFLAGPGSTQVSIGFDFNHSRLFAIELHSKGNRYELSRFASQPTLTNIKQMGHAAGAFLEKAKFSVAKINIALSGPLVLTRFIEFPKMDLKSLKASMRYEIEKYIPFQAEDVIADFHILGGAGLEKKNMKVILVAAKKAEVFAMIETFHKTSFKIRCIDIHAFACLNAFNFACPETTKGTTTLVDIGEETSALLIVTEKEAAFIREISLGRKELVEILKKKLTWDESKNETFELMEIVQKNKDLFLDAMEPLASEIRLSLNYFTNNNPKIEPPRSFYVSGELCHIPEFRQNLKEIVGLEPQTWDCLRGIEIADHVSKQELDSFRPMLPVSLGLALRTA